MDLFTPDTSTDKIAYGELIHLPGFAIAHQMQLLNDLNAILVLAPLRQMMTPMGFAMSVATSSCGALGWVSDASGYRYSSIDPLTNTPWPHMPDSFFKLAQSAAAMAGYAHFQPDACLINQYKAGTKMGLHQDKNEQDFTQPIVSVSLGISARFQFGGKKRSDKPMQLRLHHGDVLVWGGHARLHYHGIMSIQPNTHPVLGANRVNLTFRKAG